MAVVKRGPSPPRRCRWKPGIPGLNVPLPGEVDGDDDDGIGDELNQGDDV